MFEAVEFPASIPDLATRLTNVDWDALALEIRWAKYYHNKENENKDNSNEDSSNEDNKSEDSNNNHTNNLATRLPNVDWDALALELEIEIEKLNQTHREPQTVF